MSQSVLVPYTMSLTVFLPLLQAVHVINRVIVPCPAHLFPPIMVEILLSKAEVLVTGLNSSSLIVQQHLSYVQTSLQRLIGIQTFR